MTGYSHPDSMRCKACRWWVKGYRNTTSGDWATTSPSGISRYGDCRLNAPVATGEDDSSDFARSHEDDFCSKFEAPPAACPVKRDDVISFMPYSVDRRFKVLRVQDREIWVFIDENQQERKIYLEWVTVINGVPFPKEQGGAL